MDFKSNGVHVAAWELGGRKLAKNKKQITIFEKREEPEILFVLFFTFPPKPLLMIYGSVSMYFWECLNSTGYDFLDCS